MPSIDWATPATKTAEAPLPRDGSGQSRQAWLKTLEEAELRNALRSTKQFMSGKAPTTLPETGNHGKPSERQDSSRHLDGDSLFSAKSEIPEAGTGKFHSNADSPCANSNQGTSTDGPGFSTPVHPVQPTTGANLPARQPGAEAIRLLAEFAASPRGWQAQNIAVLPSGQGVEIWIRDSAMTESGVVRLLAGLRNSMASLGTSLVRVSLNGKPVYSPAQALPGNHKFKEE